MKIIVKRRVDGPSAPELGTPTSTVFNSVTVPLTRPSTGPAAITSYAIERSVGAGSTTFTTAASGPSIFGNPPAQFVDGGRIADTVYNYRARATDANSAVSAYSSTVSVTTPSEPVTSGSYKWHPGHYALLGTGSADNTTAAKNARWDEIAASGGWAGGQVRYYWPNLEPTQGNYNFSSITADVNRLASHGLKLFIQIPFARFGATTIGGTVPAYVQNSTYGGGAVVISDRAVMCIWNANLVTRLLALDAALAAEFDGNAGVAGFVAGETALGPQAQLAPFGYTDELVSTQLQRMILAGESEWTTTPRLLYCNFLSGATDSQLSALSAYAAAHHCGLGGPDIFVGNPTTGQQIAMGTIGGVDYRGDVALGYAAQTTSVTNYTPSAIHTYGVNTLRSNYIFWLVNGGTNSPWTSIKSWVAANSTTVPAIPTNLA